MSRTARTYSICADPHGGDGDAASRLVETAEPLRTRYLLKRAGDDVDVAVPHPGLIPRQDARGRPLVPADHLDVELLGETQRVVEPGAHLHASLAALGDVGAALEVELLLLHHLDDDVGGVGVFLGAGVAQDVHPVEDAVGGEHRVSLEATHAELVEGPGAVDGREDAREETGARALVALDLHRVHRQGFVANVQVHLLRVTGRTRRSGGSGVFRGGHRDASERGRDEDRRLSGTRTTRNAVRRMGRGARRRRAGGTARRPVARRGEGHETSRAADDRSPGAGTHGRGRNPSMVWIFLRDPET